MTPAQPMQINIILIFLMVVFSSGCGSSRTENLIKEGYGKDLTEFLAKSDSKIEDGLIYVRDMDQKSLELESLVNLKDVPATRNFYWKNKKISKDSWGESICKNWGDYGGVTQYAVYYPEEKLLLLGLFSGMDE